MPLYGMSYGRNVALFVAPDLTKPSYEALAWVLEHPETWPAKWHWDFAYVAYKRLGHACETAGCAAGIAEALWGNEAGPAFDFLTEQAGPITRMSAGNKASHRIFIEGQCEPHLVTAAVVAGRIRQHLAGKPITFTGHDFA